MDHVIIKGVREGLLIKMNPQSSYEQILNEIVEKWRRNADFFGGAKGKLMLAEGALSSEEIVQLQEHLMKALQVSYIEYVKPVIKEAPPQQREKNSATHSADKIPADAKESMALIIRNTVRNGQRISYHGDIIVIGDVNPGAELVAGGNIFVMGLLRGLAHAGAKGDASAMIAAMAFHPSQARIAGIIAIFDAAQPRPPYPELARVDGEAVIVEPYLPSRGKSL